MTKCPNCGSHHIHIDKKGFSLGKAAVGGVLLGPIGLLGGMLGGKKLKQTCLDCGFEQYVPEYKEFIHPQDEKDTNTDDLWIIVGLVALGSIVLFLYSLI